MAVLEIYKASASFVDIEVAAKQAIPRASILRVQYLERNDKWLVLMNTQRTYGHFAVLEWNNHVMGLHTGHYFDSMDEAVADFNGRGGDLGI